jgi:hypothetical protein
VGGARSKPHPCLVFAQVRCSVDRDQRRERRLDSHRAELLPPTGFLASFDIF